MPTLRASVLYDDWTGTAAADNADHTRLSQHLRDIGTIARSDFVVSIDLSIGENRGGKVEKPKISVLVAPLGNLASLQDYLALVPTPEFVRVHVDMDLDTFLGLFKHFTVNFVVTPALSMTAYTEIASA